MVAQAETEYYFARIRERGNRVAVVFVHGFRGSTVRTWGEFPQILCNEPRLASWDIFALGYPTQLTIDVPGMWTANPALEKISLELRSRLAASPLSTYASIALVAHSMGGLIVQRALLDPAVEQRVGHVFMFGTPSAGLAKAVSLAWLLRQAQDMTVGSRFLTALRTAWATRYAAGFPFTLRVTAGDVDEFVPATSSLGPFPDAVKRVVPGNHLAIVNIHSAAHPSAILVVDTLAGTGRTNAVIDSALVAVESRQFQQAIGLLLPHADSIDDAALVYLALALEGVGRGDEALAVLEQHLRGGTSSTDAMGVLAGRLKRRWLLERVKQDWTRARELYSGALAAADTAHNAEQSMYHAINVAFLDLMIAPEADAVSADVVAMAKRALEYAQAAKADYWRLAIEAEANLILGQLEPACERYRAAMQLEPPPRDIDSMMLQAVRVADRVMGQPAAKRVEDAFEADAARSSTPTLSASPPPATS